MSLTARYVKDSRQIIAGVEATDVTSPDLPRRTSAVLITRSTEMLRTMADHAEGLDQTVVGLRAENAQLESKVRDLRKALAKAQAAA